MNTRFYGSRNPQNSNLISSSESEDEIEDILSKDSDSYCSSELSSSDSFESDYDISSDTSVEDHQGGCGNNNRPLGTWSTVNGSHRKQFVYSDDSGIYGFSEMQAATVKPADIYSMIITDDVYNLIVEQTNLNA